MSDRRLLEKRLSCIDGRGYKAYKSIAGFYRLDDFELRFEYIQGDPFASPSLLSIAVPFRQTELPASLVNSPIRRTACADFLARLFRTRIEQNPTAVRGTGNSGRISIDSGGQEVLERSCLRIDEQELLCRCYVGLPAQGRRVLGRQACKMLLEQLPLIARESLFRRALDLAALQQHVDCVEDQAVLRSQLAPLNLVSFVANGAVLPRRSGVDEKPLPSSLAIPFESPDSMEVTFECPNAGPIRGMGIPAHISLIVGGGFHGKSTLLRAIEAGVYDHIPGDGRERVVTLANAAKIRAEDGRSIRGVNISPFIGGLPNGQSTERFVTENASGSTSQAANIVEAIELGCRLLLIDEDASATNFIIRDARMQSLVPRENEPITPLIDRIRDLHTRLSVSTILVMGGCGDYFDISDHVILMKSYRALDVTETAREVAREFPSQRGDEKGRPFPLQWSRHPKAASFDAQRGRRAAKIDAKGIHKILYGRTEIALEALEQLVETSQTRAIGLAIHDLASNAFPAGLSLAEAIQELEERLDRQGLDCLSSRVHGNLARPRALEIGAAINRMRSLRCEEE